MTLANPLALWFLLLLPIPLLIARRRRPRRRQVVSNLYLWRALARHDTAQPTFRRLRRHWLVVVQMAFIAAVIAALARPMIETQASHVAFVFDVSGSMSALDGPVTRFDLARERARAVLKGLPGRSRIRLIAAGASARDLGDFAVADPALARALQALAPAAGSADLQAAIDLATIGAASRAVYVFSDRGRPDLLRSFDIRGNAVSWETIGRAADNVALVKLAGRRLPLDPANGQVLVDLRNYGARSRDVEVEIAQDGQTIAHRALHVEARRGESLVVPATPIGHLISARLLGDDALDADNRRWSIVPPREPVRVALVGGGHQFLETALAVNPGVSLHRVASGSAGPAELRQDGGPAIVVCEGCSEPPQATGVLIVSPGTVPLEPALLTVARPDHPIAASIDVGELFVRPVASRRSVGSGDVPNGEVIVRAGGLPAVIASEHDGRRIVEFRLDLSASALTLSPVFPLLVANVIDWLAARNEDPLEIVAGEPLLWTLPNRPAADRVSVVGPDEQPRRAQLIGRRLTIAETDLPGVYQVRTPTWEQVFVVNPAVETESDLMSDGTENSASGNTSAQTLLPGQMATAPLLLLVALVVFAVEWWHRPRGRASWRILVGACLVLSASGLALALREGHIDAIVVLDRSGSVPVRAQEQGVARVNAVASTMRPGDRLGVVAFAADAALELRSAERVHLASVASTVVDTGTNIAAALRLARAALPRQGSRRILLISDGRETAGQAEKEAAYSAAEGIHVDVSLPDLQGARRESVVTRVVAPSDAQIDEPFVISVEIEGAAGARGQLSVYRDDQPFSTRDILVSAVGTASAAFLDRHQQAGIHTYRALVRNQDDDFSDGSNRDPGSGAVVSISGAPTVLYVSASQDNVREILTDAGFLLTHVAPESLPVSGSALAAYAAVVLDDVPAARFGASQMTALAGYVEQVGGGLLLLGSSRSLDLAGYPAGPLGRILPIDVRPRAGQRSPSVGLVLIFDKSGSMADLANGTPKIELARQAVMKVLDVLPSTDALGVIAFDAMPVVVAPLAPGQSARAIADRLQTIEPGGSTRIEPATALAVKWLRGSAGESVLHRQILLVSDGRTSPEDATLLRATVRNAGVGLSVVAIGANADRDLLRELADSTGGRAYFPSNMAELPLIVAREAVRSAGGSLVEERVQLRAAPHPLLAGIDRSSLPSLGGYVVSAAKPTATSVLQSHLDDPILCVWRAGLGRVALFTADLGSSWSAPLRRWPNYARLWTQVLRWVSRRTDDRSLHMAMTEGDGFATLAVDAERGNGDIMNLADVRAVVRRPSGETEEIALRASAPGRYDARVPTPSAGPYVIAVAGQERDGAIEHRFLGGFWSANRERSFHDADLGLLTHLAAITGGKLRSSTDSPFSETRPREFVDISAWVIAAALCLFVLDIVVGQRIVRESVRGWLGEPRRFTRGTPRRVTGETGGPLKANEFDRGNVDELIS